jgi:hypothetical protein
MNGRAPVEGMARIGVAQPMRRDLPREPGTPRVARFRVNKVRTMPSKRRITVKLTVELSFVPFGDTACRQAVRSPSDALTKVAVLTVGT